MLPRAESSHDCGLDQDRALHAMRRNEIRILPSKGLRLLTMALKYKPPSAVDWSISSSYCRYLRSIRNCLERTVATAAYHTTGTLKNQPL
jgi:hypothetical protein